MTRTPPSRLGPATLVAIATALLVPGLGGWQLLRARDALLVAAEQNTRTLSHALAQQATRTVESVGIVLSDVVERINHPDGQDLRGYLSRRAALLTQAHGLMATDAEGNVVADKVAPHEPWSIADRSYFAWHRQNDDQVSHVGDMVVGRGTGLPTIPVTRRVDDRDGRFAGVVVAALGPGDFEASFRALQVGPDGVLALWSGDGRLLARNPAPPGGRNAAPQARDPDFPPRRAWMRRAASPIDGVERIVSFERLDDFPLAVSAAVPVEEALAPWRHEAALEAGIIGATSCILLTLAVLLEVHRRAAARSEARSRRLDRLYRVLGRNSGDLVVVIDRSATRILHASPSSQRIAGWAPEELAAMAYGDLVHPNDLAGVWARVGALSAAEPMATSLHRLRHEAGHHMWMEAVLHLPDGEDAGQGVVVTARDVTERERWARDLEHAKAAAEHAVRQKAEFVANMSHELRTPLTGMLGIHDLLRADPSLGPLQERYVGLAHEAGRGLLAVVNDILDFSKIEAGHLTLEAVPFDPASVVTACRELVAEEARKKGITVEVDLPRRWRSTSCTTTSSGCTVSCGSRRPWQRVWPIGCGRLATPSRWSRRRMNRPRSRALTGNARRSPDSSLTRGGTRDRY